MSSALIRVMTFERLSLAHTCCYRISDEVDGYFTRPTPEEAKVIRGIERIDLELLDQLIREFDAKWATYTKPFVTFMNRVWKPRVRDVLSEHVDPESYKDRLRRTGVQLRELAEENATDEDPTEGVSTDEYPTDEDSDSEPDWLDDYEGSDEGEGWYTTDEGASRETGGED
jgi:hypothetical protein